MFLRLLLLVLFINLMTVSAWSRPPSAIDLTYDAELKTLHIDITHPSPNPRKHFIRKIFVYKNDEKVQEFSYVNQSSAAEVVQDYSLEAVSGDVIRVLAICNTAGRGVKEIIIP